MMPEGAVGEGRFRQKQAPSGMHSRRRARDHVAGSRDPPWLTAQISAAIVSFRRAAATRRHLRRACTSHTRHRQHASVGTPSVDVSRRQEEAPMTTSFLSRGFQGRRQRAEAAQRLPPGQYLVNGFPVLSAGPTPRPPLDRWDFAIIGEVDQPRRWTWQQFQQLPRESITKDIHCVTKWSKLDTTWTGVSLDTLLQGIPSGAHYVLAFSDGGYTTNLPLEDVTGGKAWIAYEYAGAPLAPEHGGPARLLVPHLYFCKSAKRVRGLRLLAEDVPGFW